MLIMLIMQIAQHMQISIRQFLYTGDPYFTFLQKNFGVLNISGFTMGLYGLATRLMCLEDRYADLAEICDANLGW